MKTIILHLLGIIGLSQALIRPDYNTVRQLIWNEICESPDFTIQGKFHRISFHDCVGDKCDGCINLENPFNEGLRTALTALDNIHSTYTTFFGIDMSKADLYALAGQVAAEFGMKGNPGHKDFMCNNDRLVGRNGCEVDVRCCKEAYDDRYKSIFDFKYGRTDCDSVSDENNNLPPSTLTHTQTFDFFAREFADVDWTDDDSVAIMGGHTLGTLKKKFSGHDGPWITGKCGKATFDNQYYINMFQETSPDLEWRAQFIKTCPSDKTGMTKRKCPPEEERLTPQFECRNSSASGRDRDCGMMLITDFNLRFDLPLDPRNHNLPLCEPNNLDESCDPFLSLTDRKVEEFAKSNEKWLDAFATAWDKMVSHGYALKPRNGLKSMTILKSISDLE